jgi:hypothetical protein
MCKYVLTGEKRGWGERVCGREWEFSFGDGGGGGEESQMCLEKGGGGFFGGLFPS